MRGYTVKKGNRYYAVIYEGIDPVTSKEKRRWYPAGTTKAEADALVTNLAKSKQEGDYRAPDKITLGDYLTSKWLPIQKARLRPSTFSSYRANIDKHVVPNIGPIPLQKLTSEDLDTFYAKLLEGGRLDGKEGGLSPKTVRYIHLTISKALSDALRKGTVTRNVAQQADAPKVSASRKTEMRVWDADQLRAFLDGAKTHRLHPLLYLAANTGMRRGEVLGLRWSDVDLEAGRISIRQALISVEYKMQMSDTKTGGSERTVDIDSRTIAILRAHRKRQIEEHLAIGPKWEDTGLVATKLEGGWFHPDLFSQVFDRMVAGSSLPRIRLHDLRHTHASLLLKAGVPVKVVSERLGHATPAFTMAVYQHVLPGMQAEAASTFSELIFGT